MRATIRGCLLELFTLADIASYTFFFFFFFRFANETVVNAETGQQEVCIVTFDVYVETV